VASTQLRASLFHGFSDHSRLAILIAGWPPSGEWSDRAEWCASRD
jgi:hypothetical protein